MLSPSVCISLVDIIYVMFRPLFLGDCIKSSLTGLFLCVHTKWLRYFIIQYIPVAKQVLYKQIKYQCSALTLFLFLVDFGNSNCHCL